MKRLIRLILIIVIFGIKANQCMAQDSTGLGKGLHGEDLDSLARVAFQMQLDAVREHQLHKDNKDSAWILDYNSATPNKVVWDSRSKSKEGKTITIIDSMTNNYYVLDTSHTIITAYGESNKIIWAVNPRKDYPMPDYRHKNPSVTNFRIVECSDDFLKEFNIGKKVITIRYSNSQYGVMALKTGKFIWLGQN